MGAVADSLNKTDWDWKELKRRDLMCTVHNNLERDKINKSERLYLGRKWILAYVKQKKCHDTISAVNAGECWLICL